MPMIFIDLDPSDNQIILTGDIDKLVNNRYASRYLHDFFDAAISTERILISTKGDYLEKIISNTRHMIHKYGFEETPSENLIKTLNYYFEDEKKFSDFSKKALDIRNNICDLKDFENFTNILSNKMTARTLYSLQLLSAYHLAFSQNACNFSVPGAGKTSIVYGAFSYLKSLSSEDIKRVDKVLVIGPLSSFGPWGLEYYECFGVQPNIKRIVSSISIRERQDYFYSSHTAEITLISYSSLVNLKREVSYFLRKNKVMVVLDEAHKIKNTNGGIIAGSVLEISKYCKSRVVLTGTPAPNGYEDLYNIFKFLWPTRDIIKYRSNQLRDMTMTHGDRRVTDLINSITPYFIRIKKSDLGIPPAKINPPVIVKMGQHQRKIYDFIEKKYMNSIISSGDYDLTSRFKQNLLSAKLIRLMQAATCPSLLVSPLNSFLVDECDLPEINGVINDSDIISDILKYSEVETPSKYIAAKEIIDSILSHGGRVIVWASFIQTILGFKEYLGQYGIVAQELYGAIPVENNLDGEDGDYQTEITREKIVRDFHNADCSYKVIIANPFAVAESISLHKACHNAIYLERTFNAAHFIQSKDRIHRYGLDPNDETNYFYVISEDSIDEAIDERLNQKEMRMNEIIENMPIPLFDNAFDGMGDEDIKSLMRNYVRRSKEV